MGSLLVVIVALVVGWVCLRVVVEVLALVVELLVPLVGFALCCFAIALVAALVAAR
jgi:hypothetical protein